MRIRDTWIRGGLAVFVVLTAMACTKEEPVAVEDQDVPPLPVTEAVEAARSVTDGELRRYVRASYRVGLMYRNADAGRRAAFASGDTKRIERTEQLFARYLLEAVAADGFNPSRYEAIRRRLGSDQQLLERARVLLDEELAKLPQRKNAPSTATEAEALVRIK